MIILSENQHSTGDFDFDTYNPLIKKKKIMDRSHNRCEIHFPTFLKIKISFREISLILFRRL